MFRHFGHAVSWRLIWNNDHWTTLFAGINRIRGFSWFGYPINNNIPVIKYIIPPTLGPSMQGLPQKPIFTTTKAPSGFYFTTQPTKPFDHELTNQSVPQVGPSSEQLQFNRSQPIQSTVHFPELVGKESDKSATNESAVLSSKSVANGSISDMNQTSTSIPQSIDSTESTLPDVNPRQSKTLAATPGTTTSVPLVESSTQVSTKSPLAPLKNANAKKLIETQRTSKKSSISKTMVSDEPSLAKTVGTTPFEMTFHNIYSNSSVFDNLMKV